MRLSIAILATSLLALASPCRGSDDELEAALAQVVDSPDSPQSAAALETIPYRMLIAKVEVAPDERTLVNKMTARFSYGALLDRPDDFRGQIVLATGIVAQIARVPAPGVGRTDRNEMHAGLLGVWRRKLVDGKIHRELELWAFRALRRPGDAILYAGDHVHMSGYFLKNVPMLDATGAVHRAPLLVAPWPTYYGKWWPAGVVRSHAGGKLPARELPHTKVRGRPVLDVREEGRLLLNGSTLDAADIAAFLRRYARRYPDRSVVVRAGSEQARASAERVLSKAGLKGRTVWKRLEPSLR